jgi:uncharacterized protein YjbI with pentapeptide repeats
LTEADLSKADLSRCTLVGTDLSRAILQGCHIYGVSAWDVRLENTDQAGLRVLSSGAYDVTVDRLDMAHLVYLALRGDALSDVIDAITDKLILISWSFH